MTTDIIILFIIFFVNSKFCQNQNFVCVFSVIMIFILSYIILYEP